MKAKYNLPVKGVDHNRVISSKDWKAVGIDAPTVEWNRGNAYMADISDLPADAIEVLKDDGSFRLIDDGPSEDEILESDAEDGA